MYTRIPERILSPSCEAIAGGGRLMELGALAVYVTFIDELSRLGASVVSMVSTVVPDDPAERTFKIERMLADGRAWSGPENSKRREP